MRRAVTLGAQRQPLTLDDIMEVHKLLMGTSPTPQLGGVLREKHNWTEGVGLNAYNAPYIPPPAEQVPELMTDLIAYVNTDHHSPLTQTAIAHAQFETIHPFANNNSPTGRALIHMVLQKRGLATRVVPPISLVLSTRSDPYIGGLTDYRHQSSPDSPQRAQALQPWLETFTAATKKACHDAKGYSDRIDQLTGQWNQKLGRYRKNSALDLLIRALPGVPLLTPHSATQLIKRSPVAVRAAITQLLQTNILMLRPTSTPRNRVLEAPDITALMTTPKPAQATTQHTTPPPREPSPTGTQQTQPVQTHLKTTTQPLTHQTPPI